MSLLTRLFRRHVPVDEPPTAVLHLPPPTGRHEAVHHGRHRAPDPTDTPPAPRGHWASPTGQWTIAHPVLGRREMYDMQGGW